MRIIKFILLLKVICMGNLVFSQADHVYEELDKINFYIYTKHLDSAIMKLDSIQNKIEKIEQSRDKILIHQKIQLSYSKIYEIEEDYQKSVNLLIQLIENENISDNPEILYNSYLTLALVHEKIRDLQACKKYLDKAYDTYKKYRLDHIYSTYCARLSSYFRFSEKIDSAIFYAKEAIKNAEKYNNTFDLIDGYLLLGILYTHSNLEESVKYTSLAIEESVALNNYYTASILLNNISRTYFFHKEYNRSKDYSDSVFIFTKKYNMEIYSQYYKNRANIYYELGVLDSAYIYAMKFQELGLKELKNDEVAEIKKITEQYENDKKESVIKAQNFGLVISIIIAIGIAFVSLILFRKNKKIKLQNTVINNQVVQLQKLLEQKKVLLSELQHRVKNNLQQVISLLEIQKESIDYNNVEEIIRQNQNRIQSMALLHSKLSYNDINAKIDFKMYLNDLSELVNYSYSQDNKNIIIETHSEFEDISIDDAVPLGLIIVELLSNSIKHAFKNRDSGLIKIHALYENSVKYILYQDDGIGIDLNNKRSGLGLEIINGLVEQLNGNIKTFDNNSGFKMIIFINKK